MSQIPPMGSSLGAAMREPRYFHVMTKPIGPMCNLDCRYCFYLEKEKLYPEKRGLGDFRMTEECLENYVRQYIEQQDVPEITFAWQGGEPTLMGVDFFRKAVEFQRKYCPVGKRIANAFQTNGTLLNEEWCRFLHENHFLIGLSLDGPREIHDLYRVNKGGEGTHGAVMRGLELLKKYEVEFNALVVVNREVARHPLEVYHFFKQQGVQFLQFIPLVERVGGEQEGAGEVKGSKGLAAPPLLKVLTPYAQVTPWSVVPEEYGAFLMAIFDEWVREDVGRVFVQMFDVQLGVEMGMPASLCVFAETCGRGLALEHNGDLYACDHYVYPQYRLGNINEKTIIEMVESEQQRRFGEDKRGALPGYCQRCSVRAHCNGECPKHRFAITPEGESGLNYLCAGYRKFFGHIKPHLGTMARLLRAGRAPAEIMTLLGQQEGRLPTEGRGRVNMPMSGRVERNEPCPCGSGRKYKKCCGMGR